MVYLPSRRVRRKSFSFKRFLVTISIWGVLGAGGVWLTLFLTEVVTLGGVPYSVLLKFWQDEVATSSYFQKNPHKLHQRLRSMGIEAEMKDYYREEIPNEADLDRHIHQILYDRTGYIGQAYRVNSEGILVLKGSQKYPWLIP